MPARAHRIARRGALASLALAAFALALPAGAMGATVSVTSRVLTYTAGAGEANRLTVSYDQGNLMVEDPGVSTITAGSGCAPNGVRRVACPAGGVDAVTAELADGMDSAGIFLLLPSTLRGGDGNDSLYGGGAADTVEGGYGNDTLDGGWGDDLIDGGGGADAMSGNLGSDRVTYAPRSGGVDVSIDGAPNDGEHSEGDNVSPSVEKLDGGAGNDRLSGDASRNKLIGNGGDDVLAGGDGDDTLEGLAGRDSYDAGAGADTVGARDDVGEPVACGSELDTVAADFADEVGGDCEAVDRSAAPPEPETIPDPEDATGNLPVGGGDAEVPPVDPPAVLLSSARVSVDGDTGVAGVHVKCPSQAFQGCAGQVELAYYVGTDTASRASAKRRRRIRIGRRKYRLVAGRSADVPVRVNRRGRRTLQRRRKMRVEVTVTTRNAVGTSVTTREVVIVYRRGCARYRSRAAIRRCRARSRRRR